MAEEYLADAFGLVRGPAKRGCGLVIRPCTLSGPQNLAGEVVDQGVRRLEELARGSRRLCVLELYGGDAAQREAATLRIKLENVDIPEA